MRTICPARPTSHLALPSNNARTPPSNGNKRMAINQVEGLVKKSKRAPKTCSICKIKECPVFNNRLRLWKITTFSLK
jgi:hypothetical protein